MNRQTEREVDYLRNKQEEIKIREQNVRQSCRLVFCWSLSIRRSVDGGVRESKEAGNPFTKIY